MLEHDTQDVCDSFSFSFFFTKFGQLLGSCYLLQLSFLVFTVSSLFQFVD